MKFAKLFEEFVNEDNIELEAEKKPGPDAYMTGLDDEEEEDKEDQIKKQADMDDDDPDAYKEMPGDKEARDKGKVKTSKHTKAYTKLYDDFVREGVMSDIHLMADEVKSEDEFIKRFFSEYGNKIKKTKDSEDWARSMYNDMVNESFESLEAFMPFIAAYITSGLAGSFIGKLISNARVVPKLFRKLKANKEAQKIIQKLEADPDLAVRLRMKDVSIDKKMLSMLSMAEMKTLFDFFGGDWDPVKYLEAKREAGLTESVDIDEKKYIYLPKYDNEGYKYAQDLIATLRSKYYRKWNDDEFDEFRRAMIKHFEIPIPDWLQESENQIQQLDSMAYGQLERCVDYATMIRERYDGGYSFDSWMYGKITKAEEHLNAVFDAMDGDDGVIESMINEDFKNDLKRFVKKNEKEIDRLADEEDWEEIYNMIYTEFDIDPESDSAKEVRTVFNLVY